MPAEVLSRKCERKEKEVRWSDSSTVSSRSHETQISTLTRRLPDSFPRPTALSGRVFEGRRLLAAVVAAEYSNKAIVARVVAVAVVAAVAVAVVVVVWGVCTPAFIEPWEDRRIVGTSKRRKNGVSG